MSVEKLPTEVFYVRTPRKNKIYEKWGYAGTLLRMYEPGDERVKVFRGEVVWHEVENAHEKPKPLPKIASETQITDAMVKLLDVIAE